MHIIRKLLTHSPLIAPCLLPPPRKCSISVGAQVAAHPSPTSLCLPRAPHGNHHSTSIAQHIVHAPKLLSHLHIATLLTTLLSTPTCCTYYVLHLLLAAPTCIAYSLACITHLRVLFRSATGRCSLQTALRRHLDPPMTRYLPRQTHKHVSASGEEPWRIHQNNPWLAASTACPPQHWAIQKGDVHTPRSLTHSPRPPAQARQRQAGAES